MSVNLGAMSSPELEERKKSLNKKLIPANIAIIIVSLVAFIAQLILPLIKIEVTINNDSIVAAMDIVDINQFSNSDESGDSNIADYEEVVKFITQEVDISVKVSIMPIDAVKAGLSKDPDTIRDYISHNATNIDDTVQLLVNQISPYFVSYCLAMITETVDDVLEGAGLENLPTDEIKQVVTLLNDGNSEEAKEIFIKATSDYYYEINGTEISQEALNSATDYFDKIVEAGTDEDGNFNFLYVLQSLDKLTEESPESSAEAQKSALRSDSSLTDATSQVSNDNFLTDLMNDPSSYISSMLDDDNASMAGIALAAVVLVFIGLTSLCWLLLALFAFFRMFAKNKKVSMWYVKLFAILPCLLVSIPIAIVKYLPKYLPAGEGTSVIKNFLEAVPISVFGSGIVSGICLGVLWLISIFWYFPINKRIRACKKELRRRR